MLQQLKFKGNIEGENGVFRSIFGRFSDLPFGGILSADEADTSKTVPEEIDREAFIEAGNKAEKLRANMLQTADMTATSVTGIQSVQFGNFEIDAWYVSPYPEEYSRNRVIYICEFCLKYMNSEYVAWRHRVSHVQSSKKLIELYS